jgi:hypothetical protein
MDGAIAIHDAARETDRSSAFAVCRRTESRERPPSTRRQNGIHIARLHPSDARSVLGSGNQSKVDQDVYQREIGLIVYVMLMLLGTNSQKSRRNNGPAGALAVPAQEIFSERVIVHTSAMETKLLKS